MAFSPDEIERYARHIVLHEVGGPGQAKLKAARVLVVGAGGLGSPVVQYLAAAGVGTLGIADDDTVSLSNLQRQVLFATADLGAGKAVRAAAAARALNPHVEAVALPVRVDAATVEGLVGAYDVVVDGSDNFATRYLVSDACCGLRRPLVTGALGVFDGTLTTLRPFETDAAGTPHPTYRCLFPAPPPPGSVPSCAEAGVLGALAGLVGSLMALEVLRAVVGFGEALVGRLLMIDARDLRFEEIRYRWDPDNPLTGRRRPGRDAGVPE